MADLRLLYRLLGRDEPWAYTVVTAVFLADALLARGHVRGAARALAKGVDAHAGLVRLAKKHRPGYIPKELTAFEERCRRTLDRFEPPVAHGAHPVRKVAEVVRRMRKPKRRRSARETIDALDAVITAGQSVAGADLEARVVEQIARMLGGRVLFHHVRGRYRVREPQQVHTLSSWTMLELATRTSVEARRIRPRPEFWRPEQRRPRGVITVPIGEGHAAIARDRPFDPRDVKAVRTILRFLEDRAEPSPDKPSEIATTRRAPTRERPQGIIGSSAAWRGVMDEVWRFGPTDCNVVILGETGTGKELVARALHMNSERADGPFVAVNCAAVHADTLLAELFGHVRGAFSGAHQSREGLVRAAHKGTLFLDEVADMPHAMQVALLRTLQERRVRPVGSERTQRVDIRVVAATHVDLETRVRDGSFREDLYHRLHVVSVALPPLRERLEDLPALCRHLLQRHGQPERPIDAAAAAALAAHDWPGNVRELENVLRAATVLAEGDAIDEEAVALAIQRRPDRAPAATRPNQAGPRAGRLLAMLERSWWSAPDLGRALGVSSRTVNRDIARLADEGLVVHDGAARARRYRAASACGKPVDDAP